MLQYLTFTSVKPKSKRTILLVQKQVSLDPGSCSKHVPAGAAAAEEVIKRRQSMDFGDAEKGETKVSYSISIISL